MKPEIIPYLPEHAFRMRELYPEIDVGEELAEMIAKQYFIPDFSFTATLDGEPIGAAGIVPLWKGVGEAWALLTPKVLKMPIFLQKAVKNGIRELQEKGRFHRIQCTVLCDFKAAQRWARHLGFCDEGLMYMFCPRKLTYRRYSIVRNL